MEFNGRKVRIDKFLKDTFNKVLDSGVISSKLIYRELTRCGIDDRYNEVDFSREVFPSLVNKNNQRNKKYGTNNVGYVDYENFSGNFCVFWNDDVLKNGDPVKLYIAWDPQYVADYVDSILDFMVKNNISYFLKVSKVVRNDMVTIRISNVEDANKVINFVNNNLKQGRIDSNPFCMAKGIVGLAIDNYNSYNSMVEDLIVHYYEYKFSLGELDVGYDDFVNFVSHFQYNKSDDKSVRNNLVFLNEVKNLIYKAITTNDINVFEDHYYSVFKNRKKKRKRYNVFNDLENKKQVDSFLMETIILFVKTTIENHGRDFTINGLVSYLSIGNTKGLSRITDSNGVKSRDLLNNIDKIQLVNMLKNKYGVNDIDMIARKMIDEIISNNMKKTNDNGDDKLSVLAGAVKDTYLKHGYEQAIMAITNFLISGYMNNFTRKSFEGNISRDLLKTVDYNDVRKRLMKLYTTDDIKNLVRFFMDDYVIEENKSKSK